MRLAFFASGNGSTFQHLVETIVRENLPATAALLVCTREDAFAVERARSLKIPSVILSRKQFGSTEEHARALLTVLEENSIEFVFLCGHLELVPRAVVAAYHQRMLNIHPALLPAFGGSGMYGRRVHDAVLAYGARISGATVHFVDEEYDHGPILAQQIVLVQPHDTAESLGARVQTAEKGLYAGALRLIVKRRVQVNDRKVTILP